MKVNLGNLAEKVIKDTHMDNRWQKLVRLGILQENKYGSDAEEDG